jgi:hypothetical protein
MTVVSSYLSIYWTLIDRICRLFKLPRRLPFLGRYFREAPHYGQERRKPHYDPILILTPSHHQQSQPIPCHSSGFVWCVPQYEMIV